MLSGRSTGRGRPSGKYHSLVDVRLLECLTRISMKYEIDSDKFFEKIVSAWRHQESTCKGLRIVCRERTIDNTHAFLFTSGHEVIAQFPIPEHILREINPLKEFIGQELAFQNQGKESQESIRARRIIDLRAGMRKIHMEARVIEISEPRVVFTRFGSSAKVANALIGDETGTIKLSLWGPQINVVSVHDDIQIENADVTWFRGERQLRIGKHGKINVVQSRS